MSDNIFFDANIFLYLGLIPKTESDQKKREISRNLLSQSDINIIISNQVLNEISNVLVKKASLTKEQIIDFLKKIIDVVNIYPFSYNITLDALEIHEQYKLNSLFMTL